MFRTKYYKPSNNVSQAYEEMIVQALCKDNLTSKGQENIGSKGKRGLGIDYLANN